MIKKIGLFILLLSVVLLGQQRGNPSQIRVRVDANGYLLAIATAQTAPITTVTFSNARLNVDANGNLGVIVSGGISSVTTSIANTFCINAAAQDVYIARVAANDLGIFTNGTACAGGILRFDVSNVAATSAVPFTTNTGTVVVNTPIANFNQTWNNAGVNFEGVKINITDTLSGANSYPFQILGGVAGIGNLFRVDNTGFILSNGGAQFNGSLTSVSAVGNFVVQSTGAFRFSGTGWIVTPADGAFKFANNAFSQGFILDTTTATDTVTVKNFANNSNGAVSARLVSAGTVTTVANVGANSCGTTAATIAGTDNVGNITVGTVAGTQCRITFAVAAPTRRHCVATDETTANLMRTTFVDSTHTDVIGTMVAGDTLTYVCFAR